MPTSVPNMTTSAQGATFAVKPLFSISHGYTGSKCAHTANCRSQKQRIHDEALTLRLSTKTSCILPDLSATFEAPQQFQFQHFHENCTLRESQVLNTNDDMLLARLLLTKPTVLASATNTVKPSSSVLHPRLFAKAAY